MSAFIATALRPAGTLIRRPAGSSAMLSSTSIRNPLFTPDVADIYVFRLQASDGVKTSITTVTLQGTGSFKRRGVRVE